MIVRRIRKHVAHHDWFAVAIDLVIAILGVFIGIQVSNWNQGRLDRSEGHEYRLRLTADLAGNVDDLTDRRRYFIAVRVHALSTLRALSQPPGRATRSC